MVANNSKNAVQGAVEPQNGCLCEGARRGMSIYKSIFREQGRDALGWARQWEKYALKHTVLEIRTLYFQACQALGLVPRRNPRMPPVSGPALQETIDHLTIRVNHANEQARIEMESCRLVLPPSTFSALERTITCRCWRK